LTGGIREGAKGEPPVAIFTATARVTHELTQRPSNFSSLTQREIPLIFFFSTADFLAYETIPEEIYLSG
jgi:hypothetical protein